MRKRFLLILWILTMAVPLVAQVPSATITKTLSWDPNTEADLAGYYVYQGPHTGPYTKIATVGVMTAPSYVVTLAAGTYCFVVTAYNTSNAESGPSNEICTAPANPRNLRWPVAGQALIDLFVSAF
jgi:hypothetical protein